jgi:ribonucleoside-diphosphate reductase alpha chain
MTETTKKPAKRTGLKVRRIHTTAGEHPYDQITWERRDVVMTNWRDGSINFEQRGVEFPDFWSVNAANIVTTKYFRGAVGSPQREYSLKQLVDRVVDTYQRTGQENGYFASDEDAEIFGHELRYALVHQIFSFNSPVWFNVGTQSPQQVSACQPYGALVSTPAGLIPIGKLVEDDAVGTKVFDAHGVTRILATKANGVKNVLRMHTKAGYALEVTADHLVWRASSENCGSFVPAGELRPGDKLQWHRRDSPGEDEILRREIAEAALAGWLQSDGFVGQYEGTNQSLTIEAMTVTDAELTWVTGQLDVVFPQVHRHERHVDTQDNDLDCRRTRLYGKHLRDFVDRWELLVRGTGMTVPARLYTAPLPVVAAYLRSIFQAEGFVSAHAASTVVEVDMISEQLIRGMQSLLLRFGIYSRVGFKRDARPDRHGCWTLRIQAAGDRRLFADEIGFIDPVKAGKLDHGFDLPGLSAKETKRLEIDRIETLGAMDVYDIQTESGEYLSGNLRVHNCFILAVDDTMDSILEWYREEGLIFKGGSGAGVNLSRIRSSKELLSSGGTASGPVSFMRGADASAGTIKSGGATRRAAKMVVLDVDHPDVREFIQTKAREENKVRALRDAGFDMDLGGKDIVSVQYQNANNSVRVSDEFMRAVEEGKEFNLLARRTGEVVEHIDARELLHEMATAAWECADPGIQYDGTINDWHTCPESGRITASNPCSEYVHLDNSSCNLASINLLKFLRDDDTFDAERFASITELIITAMDISICFADFPTEKITDVTRKFRQLGIGYANLGALLMATGHAYDSDGGRAIAAAITSLMTGTAYKTSAELAGAVGPYEGYARNAKPHKRVVRKHASASEDIRSSAGMDKQILDLANKTWAECIQLGEANGYRNAQASLLAPTGTIGLMMDCDTTGIEPDLALVKFKKLVGGGSMQIVNQTVPRALKNLGYPHEQTEAITEYIAEHGHVVNAPGLRLEHYEVFDCAMGERSISAMGHVRMMAAVQPQLSGAISKCVTGDTLIPSADGLIRISALHRGEAEDTFRDEHMVISSLDGDRKTDAFYYGGIRPVRRVRLRSGHEITGTHPHRLLVAGGAGLEWKTLAEIEQGDAVALQYGAELWAAIPASLRDITVSARYGRQKDVCLPKEMSAELAFLLGVYAAEGHTTRSNWTIRITNSVPEVLERVQDAFQDLFGIQAKIVADPGKCPSVEATSKTVIEFFEALGCGARASDKRIPDAVLRSPREMVLAFLQGLALDAYVTFTGQGKWAICLDSVGLLDDLQAIMTNLGVLHGRDYGEVYASGLQGQLMASLVPFLEPDKRARAAEFIAKHHSAASTADVVPGVTGPELYEMIPVTSGKDNGQSWRREFTFLLDSRTKQVSRRTVERISTLPGIKLPDWLRQVIDGNLHFSPVEHVVDAGEAAVFDLSVPQTHAFVANGIMNHNTVNMPESATVEDIERIYFEGWKLGLKALAIYRDNCKVGQPLTDARGKKAAESSSESATAPVIQEVQEVHRPVRRRLPRQRPATVTRFSVAGAEGYMTASSYPDDGVGEVFLKLGKQGSTLAGVMDAFSMAISVGLQYGIPLESYVAKFTNMRFEPAGLTDDPDIRIATSVMDYIFRRLALDHLTQDQRAELGILSAAERTAAVAGTEELDPTDLAQSAAVEPISSERTVVHPPTAHRAPAQSGPAPHSSTELIEAQQGRTADAPLCLTCGTKMRPAGSCYVCEGCGSTSGCS